MRWLPSNTVARRIANALLRAYRAGDMPDEWPAWGETLCVRAITHGKITVGERLQLARLWGQYGDPEWASREKPDVREELIHRLALSA